MIFSEKQISRILKALYWICVFNIIISIIGLMMIATMYIFLQVNRFDEVLPFFIGLLVFYSLSYGLKHHKYWIPSIIVFLSSLGLIYSIFFALANWPTFNNQATYNIWIIMRFLVWCMQLFILYFFTRKEVRIFFNSKESFIF